VLICELPTMLHVYRRTLKNISKPNQKPNQGLRKGENGEKEYLPLVPILMIATLVCCSTAMEALTR